MSSNNFKIPETGGFEIQYYIMDSSSDITPKKVFPSHIHDCLEVYFLIDGDVDFMVDSTIYRLNPGDAVFSRPNEIHNCICNSETVHRHACFWFLSDNDFLFGSFLHGKVGSGNLLSPDSDKKRQTILETVKKLDSVTPKNTISEFSLIISLVDMWRGCLNPEADTFVLPETMKLILDDISQNLPQIKSLSYFTKKYYISPSQLRRMFEKNLHTTPKAYIEGHRLAFSRMLLKSGVGVTEACMASGFSDLSNYIRLFKSRFGITPSDYRRGTVGITPNTYI